VLLPQRLRGRSGSVTGLSARRLGRRACCFPMHRIVGTQRRVAKARQGV